MDINFQFIWVSTKECDYWIICRVCLVLQEIAKLFAKVPAPVSIPRAMEESSHCHPSLLAFGVVGVVDSGHPDRHVVVFHCLNFQFPDT